jgi:hypothetical protein
MVSKTGRNGGKIDMSFITSYTNAGMVPSDIALSTDNINRTARIAHVVFVALDYCIMHDYLKLKELGFCVNSKNPYKIDLEDLGYIVNTKKLKNSSVSNDKPNYNPKKDEKGDKSSDNITNSDNELNVMAKSPDDIEETFRDYNIWLLLQKMLSYVILNPQKLNQLQSVYLGETLTSSDLYATRDVEDRDITNYAEELKNRKILEELENANLGTPPMNAAEEIILKLIDSLEFLTDDNMTQKSLERIANSTNELSKENDLLIEILTGKSIENNKCTILTSGDMIRLIGLKKVHNSFTSYLPTNPRDILNSALFENLLKYWGNLFLTNKSETIELLGSSLPRILERFSNSVTLSESQIDTRHYGLKLVQRFLGNSIIPQREKELSDLSKYPTAASALIAFRSLRVVHIQSDKVNKQQVIWNVSNDSTGRLDYMYIIWWLLTPEKELNILFDFILQYSAIAENNPLKKNKDINPAAMFPGNFESVGSYSSSSNIRIFLDSEKRRLKIKLDSLKNPGDFKKVLLVDNVGYEI